MSVILVDLFFGLLVASAGVAAGYFLLRKDRAKVQDPPADNEQANTRAVLEQLRCLAARVAEDVGQHSSRVQAISDDLDSGDTSAEHVIGAVSQLLDSNKKMQQQLASAEDQLARQRMEIETHAAEARTDALTGIANRRAFDDEMKRRVADVSRDGRAVSIIICDVDRFKLVNDTHGHHAGDAVLQGVAKRLDSAVGEMDIVARYGGEEFAIILPATSLKDAEITAEKARKAVAETCYTYDDVDLTVTASFGMAQLACGEGARSVVGRADEALYDAKESGRNCGYYHDGDSTHPVASDAPDEQVLQEVVSECELLVKDEMDLVETSEDCDGTTDAPQSEPLAVSTASHSKLPNKSQLTDEIGRQFARWRRNNFEFAVVIVQLDHPNELAKRYGPKGMDTLQRVLEHFLDASVRDMDFVAHHDNSSYGMVLSDATLQSGMHVAERLRAAVEKCALPYEGDVLEFSVSLGIVTPSANDQRDTLLASCEQAVSTAIADGGNVCYARRSGELEPIPHLMS